MDTRSRVELFEQIRREYEFGIGTIHGVSRKFGVHRRDVRSAIESALPAQRKVSVRASPTLDPLKPFIEAMLVADKTTPRKQRHTAHRIWTRLCQEVPQYPVAESTVRTYVRERKGALGLAGTSPPLDAILEIADALSDGGISSIAPNKPQSLSFDSTSTQGHLKPVIGSSLSTRNLVSIIQKIRLAAITEQS